MGLFILRKAGYESVMLQASAVNAVAGTTFSSTPVYMPLMLQSVVWELDVTATAAASGDTLDVWIQTTIDGNTVATPNWVDIVHFTQLLGTTGAKRYFAKTCAGLTIAMFENATALAAGSIRDVLGDAYRARWSIVDGGAHGQSFTFSVSGCPS